MEIKGKRKTAEKAAANSHHPVNHGARFLSKYLTHLLCFMLPSAQALLAAELRLLSSADCLSLSWSLVA